MDIIFYFDVNTDEELSLKINKLTLKLEDLCSKHFDAKPTLTAQDDKKPYRTASISVPLPRPSSQDDHQTKREIVGQFCIQCLDDKLILGYTVS